MVKIKTDETKAKVDSLKELSESCSDLTHFMKDTAGGVKATKKLWRSKNKSTLIKVGLALIAFPDPTISDIVGGVLVAAGTVQEGIRRNTLHIEDVPKTFQSVLKEIRNTKYSF